MYICMHIYVYIYVYRYMYIYMCIQTYTSEVAPGAHAQLPWLEAASCVAWKLRLS